MKDIRANNIKPDVKQKSTPWWNRRVFGKRGLLYQWFRKFFGRFFPFKEVVSEGDLFLYKRAMLDVQIFGKTAESIDDEKFGKEEFLIFVKLKYLLNKNIDEYGNLYSSVQLLQVAIDAKDSFIALFQTEMTFMGSKQQEFYEYTEGLLSGYENPGDFRDKVGVKLGETLNQIKTEEGRDALEIYGGHLDKVSKRDLGLKLLSLFKAYHLSDYSILRRISDLVQGLEKADLHSYETLKDVVISYQEDFQKIGRIIGLPKEKNTVGIYARMVQYIALDYRYALSFSQFDELIGVMKRWYVPYQKMIKIRELYPPAKYEQRPEFKEPIPGESTYFKYIERLTDKKTGMVYIEFKSEE